MGDYFRIGITGDKDANKGFRLTEIGDYLELENEKEFCVRLSTERLKSWSRPVLDRLLYISFDNQESPDGGKEFLKYCALKGVHIHEKVLTWLGIDTIKCNTIRRFKCWMQKKNETDAMVFVRTIDVHAIKDKVLDYCNIHHLGSNKMKFTKMGPEQKLIAG